MKLLKNILFTLFIIVLLVTSYTPVYAQPSTQLLFAVTPYQSREDIDFLIVHSVHPLDYLEGAEINTPVFLSIISGLQKNELIKAGYKPKIIDENAGEMTQYYILEHWKQNNEYQIKGFEISYNLSDFHTLIKLPPGKNFMDVQDGPLTGFAPRQFTHDLAQPPMSTRNILTPSPTLAPTVVSPSPVPEDKASSLIDPLIITFLIVVLIIGGGVLFYLKRKSKLPPQQPPVTNPPQPVQQPLS